MIRTDSEEVPRDEKPSRNISKLTQQQDEFSRKLEKDLRKLIFVYCIALTLEIVLLSIY